jgi:ABC-2 type transport system permease protein
MEPETVAIETPGGIIKTSRVQRFWTGVYIIWLRDFKRFWRDRVRRVAAFVQPLVFLFILGTGLQAAFKVFGAGGKTKYVVFMYPGILGMTVLFTSVFSAMSILWDREFGFLKEVLVSPVPRSSVAVGKIFGGATTACLQGAILMVLAFFPWFFGASFETLGKVLLLIPIMILLSFGMTAVGVAIAARLKSFEAFPLLMNFFLMPLFFLSGAMFPLQGLPGWMTVLTKVNPLAYGVDMLRGILLHGVQVTSATISINPKLMAYIAKAPPEIQAAARNMIPKMPQLQVQRYPMWLSLVVVSGFGIAMLFIAIWQFGRTE